MGATNLEGLTATGPIPMARGWRTAGLAGSFAALVGVGACHPVGGTDPRSGDPPLAPAAAPIVSGSPPPAVASVAPARAPPLRGSTCAPLEAVGARATRALFAPSVGEPVPGNGEEQSAAAISGQCRSGERLEGLVTVPPAGCVTVEILGVPPVLGLEVTLEAHADEALAPFHARLGPHDVAQRLETPLCSSPARALPIRLELAVLGGGGVVAARVFTRPLP